MKLTNLLFSALRYVAGLEERERELLTRIDHVRQVKGKQLTAQLDNLRHALAKLARTSEFLNDNLETGSGYDLIAANEKACAELKRIRCIRSELRPCEDDGIAFLPPDGSLFRAVTSMGCVSMSSGTYMVGVLGFDGDLW